MADSKNMTEVVVENLTKGYNLEQIAQKFSLDTSQVFSIWQDYVNNRREMPREEQWLLHLLRLEDLLVKANKMLDYAWDEPKAFEATAKILERIEELQNLNYSRIEEAKANQAELTRAQVAILFQVLDVMRESMKKELASNNVQGEFIETFDANFADMQQHALEQVNSDEDQ